MLRHSDYAAEQKSRERSMMDARTLDTRTLSVVTVALAVAGFANLSAAQEAQKLFIEGDIVRGNTPAGITGPVCVLANQFKRKENVVFRIRVRNAAGTPLDDKNIRGIGALRSSCRTARNFRRHTEPARRPA